MSDDKKLYELKAFRNSKGLTQAQFAKLLGLTEAYYRGIETGQELCSSRTILKIKKLFTDMDVKAVFPKHFNQ